MNHWVGKHPVVSIAILFLFLIPLLVGTLGLINCNVAYDPESVLADWFREICGSLAVSRTIAAFVIHWKTAKAHANSGTKPNR